MQEKSPLYHDVAKMEILHLKNLKNKKKENKRMKKKNSGIKVNDIWVSKQSME